MAGAGAVAGAGAGAGAGVGAGAGAGSGAGAGAGSGLGAGKCMSLGGSEGGARTGVTHGSSGVCHVTSREYTTFPVSSSNNL